MIDTHSHIYEKEYDLDRQEVVENARRKNVSQTILANVDSSTIAPMKQTAQEIPDFFAMAMGLHPTSITANNMTTELEQIRTELETGSYCAIG
ncbi:MAG TPA: TatD family hydrolase, partial [Paludibacteraceae bacterium]|nr:TatD family hydrolase [Paludibacteraceae bacterium]